MRLIRLLLFPLVGVAAHTASAEPQAKDHESVAAESESSTGGKQGTSRPKRPQALAALRANKSAEAENLLGELSSFEKLTPPWNFEMAVNLIRLAFDARAAGDEAAAQKAASRALKKIESAEAGYSDQPAKLSTLQDLRAVLQKDFLGTAEQAEAHYREAARLNPASPAAKERIERIDRRRAEAAQN